MPRTGKSQSSLQIEVDGCPLYSASRKQKARAHSSGEAQYCAAASAASEAMLIREVVLFTEVRTELQLDTAASRGICRREGVGAIRQLSTKVLWPQQLGETRSGHTVGARSSAEIRADLETKPLLAYRLQQLRHWNGLALDRNERLATGDKKVWSRREGAAGSCSANNLRSWAKRQRSLRRTGEPGEGCSWNEVSIGTSGSGKRFQRIDRAGLSGYGTWLESRITSVYERTTCARLLAMVQLRAIPLL